MRSEKRRLIIVGSRMQAYREYALASLADSYDLALVMPEAPSWHRQYIATSRIADTGETSSLLSAVESLMADRADVGILTWDEFSLVSTAEVAEKLGLRHMSAAAARTCRDKFATRSVMDRAGLPAVRHRLVGSEDEAVRAASHLGLPVVVKPPSLGGSLGVSLAATVSGVRDAYRLASGAHLVGIRPTAGVLVEEFLVGPEISVDSCIVDGVTHCLVVARKRLGFQPYFEEVGHLVSPWKHEPWADRVIELVAAAHGTMGIECGTTHAEIRLTSSGPRLIEMNGRLGGDLIPHIGRLATGLDLPKIAAAISFGDHPSLTPSLDCCVEIRFLYPPHDGVLERLDMGAAAAVAGIAATVTLATCGDELQLPPRALTPRVAAIIAAADTEAGCRSALDQAEGEVHLTMSGSVAAKLGAVVENAVTRRFLASERGMDQMQVQGVKGVSWFRYGAAGADGVNRPIFLTAHEKRGLEYDLNGVFQLVKSIPDRLFGGDRRRFAQAVGMSPTQVEVVVRGGGSTPAAAARADMYRETSGFKLLEFNMGSSLGGWQMAEFARALMYDQEFRRFTETEGLSFPDTLQAIADVMLDECSGMDLPSRPRLAITDWPGGFEQTKCWMDFVVPAWMRMGFDPVVCHAGEFEHRGGAVFLHGRKVDIIYRMFLPAEMADEPRTLELVDPILRAVERGTVHLYAGLDCEVFGSKASLAMLSDERNRTIFTAGELELIDRVLPWTRFLRAEHSTRLGERVDLLPYVLANREHLLIKPTSLFGSRGVTAGWSVDDSEWNAQVNAAAGGPFVVQERVLPTTERFVNGTGQALDEMVVLYGIMLVGGLYAGALARVNPDKNVGILNITNAEIGCTFHIEDHR